MTFGCGCGNESKALFCFFWWIAILLVILAIIWWLWMVFGCKNECESGEDWNGHLRNWGCLAGLWLAVIAFGVLALVAWLGWTRFEMLKAHGMGAQKFGAQAAFQAGHLI